MIYLQLFLTFMEIGAFTFGGGYAMIPLIEEKVVANGWMTAQDLVNFIAVSESTPGPFAINISTYVGMETGGILGALCATVGVVLPSFFIILIVARCYQAFSSSRPVKGAMSGLRPVVVGLIGASVLTIGKTVFVPAELPSLAALFTPTFFLSLFIFALMVLLVWKFRWHPILIIVLSAGLGIGLCLIRDALLPQG